ncbi:MAG: site-2 protease family protein [Gammaproteobacteria bacterium]|jgi:Zn-dependent protease
MIKWALLFLQSAKYGKALLSGGSMLLSVFAYSLLFGWRYAVGFVVLIFIHEMGHYIAARQRGLNVSLPAFIPFVGAWIQLKELPHSVETEAYVGLAGPYAGTIASLVCYLVADQLNSQLLYAISYAGFIINLFNMLPLSPLDGGRITAIVSPKMWFIGVPLLIALFLYQPSPLYILVAILAIPQLLAARKLRGDNNDQYYDVSLNDRVNYAIWYLGLVALLGYMSLQAYQLVGY